MAYEFKNMSQRQLEDYLKISRHAIVATNRVDGPPQISPVWYLYEDGRLFIGVRVGSAKYHNLQRDPRISICIDAGHPDARSVTIYGTAELIEEDSSWRDDISWRITRRYIENDKEARQLIEADSAGTKSALVVVTPTKTIARDYN